MFAKKENELEKFDLFFSSLFFNDSAQHKNEGRGISLLLNEDSPNSSVLMPVDVYGIFMVSGGTLSPESSN